MASDGQLVGSAVTLINKLLAHDAINIKRMSGICRPVEHRLHYILPFFAMRADFTIMLVGDQVGNFVRHDLCTKNGLVLFEQGRIIFNEIKL